ncbi:solanesyl-diphosphate synthase 2, chloroplastic-like [Wolffia australiana]
MMALNFPGAVLRQRGLGVSSCGCPWNGGSPVNRRRGILLFRRASAARCRVSSAQIPPVVEIQGGEPSSSGPVSMSSLLDVVGDDLKTLNKNLQSIIGAENPVLAAAAEQIFGAGGKRLRPALVFLVSRATASLTGLKDLTPEHRRLAEIVEMIHTASLVHDDVLDDSGMRRGKETIHQLYGTRVAVLAGDYMFAQSSWYLANLENIEVIKLISQVIKDFASGEIKQASTLFNCDIELDDYLLKSYYKTASLIAASAKSAAIFSGVSADICAEMFDFGRNLGLAFQIVDDVLDFTESAEQLGKPAGADLAKGNLTAPVIFALRRDPRLREMIDSEFCERGDLERAVEMVVACGGVEQARELALEKAMLAVRSLSCLPASEYRTSLERLVHYILLRVD